MKLLHAVVMRMADVHSRAAAASVRPWRDSDCSIYRRLWAAAALNGELASAGDTGNFLKTSANTEFWDLHRHPEITELRAQRFTELDPSARESILRRLRNGPPRTLWPTTDAAPEVKVARRHWAARELRRIQVAGGDLPERHARWLREAMNEFPDLEAMAVDSGFRASPVQPVQRASQRAAEGLDEIDGIARLQVLNEALSGDARSADDIGYANATAWMGQPKNALLVLSDFESAIAEAHRFPQVCETFCSYHALHSLQSDGEQPRDASSEAQRVLRLLCAAPKSTLESALESISNWLRDWSRLAVQYEYAYTVWFRIWADRGRNNQCRRAQRGELHRRLVRRLPSP